MKVCGGEYRYCVASVNVDCTGIAEVTYYAYQNNNYGLHRVSDINDEFVLWYDSEAKAKQHILNVNNCIISRFFEGNKL